VTAPQGSVVTIGNFDGVHLGHQALVTRTAEIAAQLGVPAVAVTFDPHPAAVLAPAAVPLVLQPMDERVAVLRAHGIDDVVVVAFDERYAAQSAERFVADLLVARLGAVAVVVGENFRFGAGAAADTATLAALGPAHGFTVETVGLVADDGRPFSSSVLRGLLAAGDVEAVARGLGRSFSITGEVVRGDGRGRTIGVPTANIAVGPGRALPADGVYACWAWPGGTVIAGPHPPEASGPEGGPGRVPAVVNVGWRPTFEGTTRTVEAHLLLPGGVDGPDLYGRPLTVAVQARIRGEQRFDGPEGLVARITEDISAARRLLGIVPGGPQGAP